MKLENFNLLLLFSIPGYIIGTINKHTESIVILVMVLN